MKVKYVIYLRGGMHSGMMMRGENYIMRNSLTVSV